MSLAFGLGIHFIMRHSIERCDQDGIKIISVCDGDFYMTRIRIGLACAPEGQANDRRPCPSECWEVTYLPAILIIK